MARSVSSPLNPRHTQDSAYRLALGAVGAAKDRVGLEAGVEALCAARADGRRRAAAQGADLLGRVRLCGRKGWGW